MKEHSEYPVRRKVLGMDVWIVAEKAVQNGDFVVFFNCGRADSPYGHPVDNRVAGSWSTSRRNLEPHTDGA